MYIYKCKVREKKVKKDKLRIKIAPGEGNEAGCGPRKDCFIRFNYITKIYASITCVIKNSFLKKRKKECKYRFTDMKKNTLFGDWTGRYKMPFWTC